MADTTPNPKLRRRRWVIVGVLLFLVAITGWWCWQRGDARFVGTWDWTDPYYPNRRGRLTLNPDGTADQVISLRPDGRFVDPPERIKWSTSTDSFFFGHNASKENRFVQVLDDGIQRWLPFLPGWRRSVPARWSIVSVERDRIVLRQKTEKGANDWTLNRISVSE